MKTPNKRQLVFHKFHGCCAYCGTELLQGWNIDHIKPVVQGGSNELENLNPSCKDCNKYKSVSNLEEYRTQLFRMLNKNHQYLFKSKTKMQVALNMGSVVSKPWNGLFYFESLAML